jgi:hypothetical protein
MKTAARLVLGLRLAMLPLGLSAAVPVTPHVVVAGRSLPADAVAVIDNRTYVAVRAIGQALEAYVTTNPAEKLVTVTTLLRQVVLYVDSPRAIVNGQTVVLGAPPRRNGTRIMLPLRALADLFGARVSYKAQTHGVVITFNETQPVGSAPSLQPRVTTTTYTGTVVAVNAQGRPPTIQFTSQGKAYTASVSADTPIEFRDVRGAMTGQGTLAAVRPGDALIVTLDAGGRLISVADLFASVSGTIASVADQSMVLTNGRVVSAGGQSQVTLDGKPATFASLRAGDDVTVREDPVSGAVRDVIALTPGGYAATATATPQVGAQPVVSITHAGDDAARPLRAGDVLRVSLDGTPGGSAEFDISNIFTGSQMREVRPGHYEGEFQVSVGTNITNAPVLVRLRKDGQTALAQTAHPVTIITTPPSVGEIEPGAGAQINIARPNIVATFVTVGDTGMNPQSLVLTVNGSDVTGRAIRTPSFISYYPPADLPSGRVNVRLKGTDIAGNGLQYSWSFTIESE